MLVISRKARTGFYLVFGETEVYVQVSSVDRRFRRARVAIDAPPEVLIIREELKEEKRQ